MVRPIRIEYAGALYHVTSRGNRRENIYLDDEDRMDWLTVLGQTCKRFNWVVHAYCQMTNHYHLLVETIDGNLSRGMRQLNGVYTQRFNRRHSQTGHLLQGRYKAILVQHDSYLLELSRYIVLNPIRARMVEFLDTWPWSSYPAVMGTKEAPAWLDTDWLVAQFGNRRKQARRRFRDFIREGMGLPSPLQATRHQLLLGDDAFVDQFQEDSDTEELQEYSKSQKRAITLSLREFQNRSQRRNEAMANAYDQVPTQCKKSANTSAFTT